MYCDHCGKTIKEGARFCPFCGCDLREDHAQSEANSDGFSATSPPNSAYSAMAGSASAANQSLSKKNMLVIGGCAAGNVLALVFYFNRNTPADAGVGMSPAPQISSSVSGDIASGNFGNKDSPVASSADTESDPVGSEDQVEEPPEDVLYPYSGTSFVTSEPKLGIFVRSDYYVDGNSRFLNDGNKIGWIEGGDTSVKLIATGKEYHEGGEGHWWYEVEIPAWYRETARQTENYAGKTLIGWVRDDVVREG